MWMGQIIVVWKNLGVTDMIEINLGAAGMKAIRRYKMKLTFVGYC